MNSEKKILGINYGYFSEEFKNKINKNLEESEELNYKKSIETCGPLLNYIKDGIDKMTKKSQRIFDTQVSHITEVNGLSYDDFISCAEYMTKNGIKTKYKDDFDQYVSYFTIEIDL